MTISSWKEDNEASAGSGPRGGFKWRLWRARTAHEFHSPHETEWKKTDKELTGMMRMILEHLGSLATAANETASFGTNEIAHRRSSWLPGKQAVMPPRAQHDSTWTVDLISDPAPASQLVASCGFDLRDWPRTSNCAKVLFGCEKLDEKA